MKGEGVRAAQPFCVRLRATDPSPHSGDPPGPGRFAHVLYQGKKVSYRPLNLKFWVLKNNLHFY